MPRLNVETGLWTDPRFQRFMIAVGDRHRAMGILMDLWTLAQKHWIPAKKLIPMEVWQSASLPESLVDCGLAELRDDGVYARGAEGHFQWWFDGMEQRQRAGKHRAKGAQRDSSGRWVAGPLTPAASSAIQPSSSPSSSKDLNTIVQRKRGTEYTDDFEALYAKYPRHEGKADGFKAYRKSITMAEDRARLEAAIQNYSNRCRRENREPQFIKQFSTFMNNWQDYEIVDAGTPLHMVKPV